MLHQCGDAMWNGVVHVEYGGVLSDARCEMWLWNRVMWNDLTLLDMAV